MIKIGAIALLLMCAHLAAEEPAEPAPPPAEPAAPAEVSAKQVDSLCVVVLPMKGSYAQHESAIPQLMTYLTETLMVAPLGPPFGRYFNNPMEAAEADLEWEIGMEVAPGTVAEAPFEAKTLPGGEVAFIVVRGPYETAGNAWPGVYMWAMTRGYTPTGPPMELWLGGEGPETELRLPIAKPAPATP
ncbi:GyrI-like domain-containing protein [Candidatus Fermentibacteria bacterium]|nr:GyrI-like domain-containing protein [Candidatus Fermentibacteria bacterium]